MQSGVIEGAKKIARVLIKYGEDTDNLLHRLTCHHYNLKVIFFYKLPNQAKIVLLFSYETRGISTNKKKNGAEI